MILHTPKAGTLGDVVASKIIPRFFQFGDGAYVLQRVTVLNQYTDYDDDEAEVLVTEELGEIRSSDDTLVVVYHDYEE